MITEIVNVSIDGQIQDDLVPDVVEVEVEDDVDSASVFRVRLTITAQNDGTWSYVDDPRFALWKRVAVQAGYPESNDTIIDGYITHVRLTFSDTQDSTLEISGMDASAMMDLEEKQLAWVSKKDSEIAQEVFQAYGLSYEVEDTVVRHEEAVATVLQTETDIRFLRRLAARNGFVCYVKGSKGYFRSPSYSEPPQKLLAINFGPETNLSSLTVEIDGTPAAPLEIRRIDPVAKKEETETLADTPRRAIGARSLVALRSDVRPGKRLLKQQLSSSTGEMQGRLRGSFEQASRFVTASGEIDSRSYGAVLRAKGLVTIKGAGALVSGLYYVTRVRHHFTTEGYQQHFEGARNGTGLTGDEDFASPSGLVPAVPGAGAPSVSTGNLVLPAQQSASNLPGGS